MLTDADIKEHLGRLRETYLRKLEQRDRAADMKEWLRLEKLTQVLEGRIEEWEEQL